PSVPHEAGSCGAAAGSLGDGDAAAGGVAPLPQPQKAGGSGAEADAARLAFDLAASAHDLAARLEGRGIRASSEAVVAQLQQGWGESVC
ncbi:unnamed protein product, partial [Prorocentrum cordatum]